MIIKILPIKTLGGIARLAEYIAIDKGNIKDYRNQGVFHNVLSTSLKKIVWEFRNNYQIFARKRSNGNKAIHIILSMSPLDYDKMTVEKMDDIVQTYLEKAYPHALAFGSHHQHEKHFHSHIMVSPNELMSKTSTRLSKQDLRAIHLEMLGYIRENHPELSTDIDKENWGRKLHSEKAYYKEKRNPNLKLTRAELSEKVQELFRQSESSQQFFNLLKEQGYTTYNLKDKVQGVFWNDGTSEKKMRFARLGIEKEKFLELDKQADRLKELEEIRFDQDNEVEREQGERDFEGDAER